MYSYCKVTTRSLTSNFGLEIHAYYLLSPSVVFTAAAIGWQPIGSLAHSS